MTSLRLHHRLEEDTSTTKKTELAAGRYVAEEYVGVSISVKWCRVLWCSRVQGTRISLFISETQYGYI